jgi:hypothetical protein
MSGKVSNLGVPIVLDIGTYATKVGFAGERNPRAIVRTLVGRDTATKGLLFGDQVLPVIDHVHLHKPILDGCLVDEVLGDFKRFTEYIITQVLKADPAGHPLLLLVNGKGVGVEWDAIAHRVYSRLGSPALCILRSGMACLYGLGHATATIVQVGAGPLRRNYTRPTQILSHEHSLRFSSKRLKFPVSFSRILQFRRARWLNLYSSLNPSCIIFASAFSRILRIVLLDKSNCMTRQ